MDHLLGYARVSTTDQQPQLQVDALKAAGCYWVFTETASGPAPTAPPSSSSWTSCAPVTPWLSGNPTASAVPCGTWSTPSPAWSTAASGSAACRRRSTPPPRAASSCCQGSVVTHALSYSTWGRCGSCRGIGHSSRARWRSGTPIVASHSPERHLGVDRQAERAWLAMQASSGIACWSASTPLGRGRGAMLVDVDIAEFGGRTAVPPDRHRLVRWCGG